VTEGREGKGVSLWMKEETAELQGSNSARSPSGCFEPLGDFGGDEL
jgi:hypothetical protein